MCKVYQRFAPKFSELALPLDKKLKEEETLHFNFYGDARRTVMISKVLITPPVLALSRSNGHMSNIDTRNTPVTSILLQEQENKILKPISYLSRSLCDAEPRYETTHKKYLQGTTAVLMLESYLKGSHFILRSKNLALWWILEPKYSMESLARGRFRLMKLDFEIFHLSGMYH